MQKLLINQVAVLGAGVMGAQIAAHFANCGFSVLLYDLPGRAMQALQILTKLKPSPLASQSGYNKTIEYITPLDYDNNLDNLRDVDLIIEAVAENIDIKFSLYNRIKKYINNTAIFCTNTSGLSINQLAQNFNNSDNNLAQRFCGVHFFNPPRYQKLVELIGHSVTDPKVLDSLEEFFISYLGKGIVRAHDTPNFIANRIGVFSMLATMYNAEKYNLGFDLVDALTGELIGRPKSATFRTADVVGLDTLVSVMSTMERQCTQDPWLEYLKPPQVLRTLVEQKSLGQKTGQGFYRKSPKDGKTIEVYDHVNNQYNTSKNSLDIIDKKLLEILKIKNVTEKFLSLKNYDHPQSKFLWAIFRELWLYSAYHLAEISGNVRDIDQALKWGFGWKLGPFELWQAAGWDVILELLQADLKNKENKENLVNIELPNWVTKVTDYNKTGVYKNDLAYDCKTGSFTEKSNLPVYIRLNNISNISKNILLENADAKLWLFNQNLIFSFKTKANILNTGVIDLFKQAIDYIETNNNLYSSLVIWQDQGDNFCAGADLNGFMGCVNNNDYTTMDNTLKLFQDLCQKIRYCRFPVVAAAKGMILGGGTELLMHCDQVVASLESYIGLVEVGVGLLPAGGGCKEMLRRANQNYFNNNSNSSIYAEIDKLSEQYFKAIATAQVSTSAIDAKNLGYLRNSDIIIVNPEELLFVAVACANNLACVNYSPPRKARLRIGGPRLKANIQSLLVNYLVGNFITKHDYAIALKLADVLSGGDLNSDLEVPEQWLLDLERKSFIELLQAPATQERIKHMLATGRPLRN